MTFCRIDRNGVVKVADFGLTEDVYNTKYLSVEVSEERLPIRWMAPESIESNMFNEKTDVVSINRPCRNLHNHFTIYSGHME